MRRWILWAGLTALVVQGQTNGQLQKAIEDVQWKLELSDIADVSKFRYTRPSRAKGAEGSMMLYAYSFLPKQRAAGEKKRWWCWFMEECMGLSKPAGQPAMFRL